MTSPDLTFDAYPGGSGLRREDVVHIMVGDLQRLRVYAEKGFQIPVPVSESAWAAHEHLVRAGYVDNLVKS